MKGKENKKLNENNDHDKNDDVQKSEINETPVAEQVDYKDKYIRLLAEYTNFANQKEAEISAMAKFANKNLITKILDIIDDIEAGLNQEQVNEETKSILKILKIKIMQILAMESVLEIELSPGDPFDPEKCEAVKITEDKNFSGKIVQVLRKGYTISDKVLRTAKVIAGK
jgi:molecular chaperone GrpE